MLALQLARCTTPRTRTAWCAGCRRGRCVTPWPIQNSNTLFSSSHSSRQAARLEVERIDVLVLLRRVLGVLHRAVGPPAEPLRMLLHVRVVGRALERDVERDLDAALLAPRRPGRRKSSSVPSSGWIALWPPSFAPIAQGLPTSPGFARDRVVLALARRRADRDGSAAGRARRSPSPRRTAGASSTSRNVPCVPSPRAERGNSSYQVRKRARTGRPRLRAFVEVDGCVRRRRQLGRHRRVDVRDLRARGACAPISRSIGQVLAGFLALLRGRAAR